MERGRISGRRMEVLNAKLGLLRCVFWAWDGPSIAVIYKASSLLKTVIKKYDERHAKLIAVIFAATQYLLPPNNAANCFHTAILISKEPASIFATRASGFGWIFPLTLCPILVSIS